MCVCAVCVCAMTDTVAEMSWTANYQLRVMRKLTDNTGYSRRNSRTLCISMHTQTHPQQNMNVKRGNVGVSPAFDWLALDSVIPSTHLCKQEHMAIRINTIATI